MLIAVPNGKIIKWLMVLLLCLCGDVLTKNSYKSGDVRADYPKGCAYLRCKKGDQCVRRKFWCKNPPCPSMLYCSRTRKESLKGPSSCEAVRCSKGFVCLVRARHCRWGEECEQQIARCISERDYYEGPASCADFRCPSGHRCILRESLCAKAPCKLLKSCANTKDVNSWFEGCKSLGCLSEHECFLRRPDDDCTKAHCKHTPDCLAKSEEELAMNEQCRGWVCPRGEECSSHTEGPCKGDSCRISRSCHKPMMVPANSTRPRKHSWKDDVKLSFYTKFYKDTTEKNNPPRLSTAEKISRERGGPRNKKITTNTAIEEIHDRPIYKAPVYVTANTKVPKSSGPSFASPDSTSGHEVLPTVTSLSSWLNHLKLKTGVDAIEAWVRKADQQESYGEFLEWLESVKEMLGTAAYDLWLEEVRAMTVTSTAFQKWLPPDTRYSVKQNGNSVNFESEGLGLDPGLRTSIKSQANEDYNYSHRENVNGRQYETGSMKKDYSKDDDYIIPPHAEPPTMMPHIGPTIAANAWSRFYPQSPRIFQQTYPFTKNIGHIPPWANKVSEFRDFDPTSMMNPWYQQLPMNWSFETPVLGNRDVSRPDTGARPDQFLPPPNHQQWYQQLPMNWSFETPVLGNRDVSRPETGAWPDQFVPPPNRQQWYQQLPMNWSFETPVLSNRDISRPETGAWPDQFVPPPNHQQWQQERDSPHRFGTDRAIESTRSPTDFTQVLADDPLRYYSRNSANQDPPWIKYFFNPYRTSEVVRASSFGSFPVINENFDGYASRPGFDYEGRNNADMPHRRSKHEGSIPNFGLFRYGDRDEDRSEEKSLAMPEDTGFYSSRSGWPIADPRLRQYHRYLVDYNRRNRKENKNSGDPPPTLVAPGLLGFHRPGVEPRSQSPNRYFPDDARELSRPEDHWPNYYKQEHLPMSLNQRGFLFGNREHDSHVQPMGVPDLWDPRYRTPLSSNDNSVDGGRLSERDMMEKVVPVLSSRKRVSPNWILPIGSEESHYREDDDYRKDENTEDYHADDEEEMHSLLFSLQGYIESPDEGSWQDAINSTILPVYATDDDAPGRDDCINYYAGHNDDAADDRSRYQHEIVNFFKNPKYGGNPDFPNYLKSVMGAEAAIVMQNITGARDIEIKGIKWEYEDEGDEQFVQDSLRFAGWRQKWIPPTSGLPNINRERDSAANRNERGFDDGGSENDYYEDGIDYEEKSYSNLEQIDGYGLVNNEDVGDYFTDRFYDDSDHRRFKKNRPL